MNLDAQDGLSRNLNEVLLRYWLFICLTLLFTTLMGVSTFSTARMLQKWVPDRNLLLMPAENLLRVVLIGVCLLLGWLSGLSPMQLGWSWSGVDWMRSVGMGVAWGGLMALFFFLSTRWLIAATGMRFYSSVLVDAILPRTRREFLLVAVVMIAVVTLEELLFRSLLIGGLVVMVPPWVLLVVWGVVFGALHSPQGLWGMVGAGMAGVFFGVLFLSYGSVLTPVVAHYVANMVQIVLAVMSTRGEPG